MKNPASKIKLFLFVGVYLVAGVTALSLLSIGDVFQLKEQLKTVIPLFLEINFVLILLGLTINLGIMKKIFAPLSKKQILLLVAVCVSGILLSALIPARTHRIYYDEDIYLHIAQNMNAEKKAQACNFGTNEYGEFKCFMGEYYKEPYGYSYIVSLVFRVFGTRELAAHLFNNLLCGLAVLVVFLIVFVLFDHYATALYASLLFLLIPWNLIWSNTTAAEPATAFFAGLALLFLFLYLKEKKPSLLFLAFTTLPFAVPIPARVHIASPGGSERRAAHRHF